MEKRALGKGLEALLPTGGKPPALAGDVQQVAIDLIIPNRYQPRTVFHETELKELADSIKQHGILQPVVVRRRGDGVYELIAGERRFRAAKMAGLSTVPVIVKNTTDDQSLILALLENLQREDLNPMEAARAYQRMMTEFSLTQEALSQRLGKDRSSVANVARFINLPNEIQQLVESGSLSSGHAKVLLSLSSADGQVKLARRIAAQGLSVRQTEALVAKAGRGGKGKRHHPAQRAASDLEEKLQRRLGTRVRLVKSRTGGQIVIDYFTPGDLDRLIELLLG